MLLCFKESMSKMKQPKELLYKSKLAKINFAFVAVFAIYTIIFDAGNILTREDVYHRWVFAVMLLIVYSLFWVATKKAKTSTVLFGSLILCVVADLILAGFMTYWERGMASMSTILYMLPIASMALSGSRTYTVATSLFAAAIYIGASTKYFFDFFNEGYRVQLYGQLFFFGAVFLLAGWAVAILAHAYSKK